MPSILTACIKVKSNVLSLSLEVDTFQDDLPRLAMDAITLRGQVYETIDGSYWKLIATAEMPSKTHWIRLRTNVRFEIVSSVLTQRSNDEYPTEIVGQASLTLSLRIM